MILRAAACGTLVVSSSLMPRSLPLLGAVLLYLNPNPLALYSPRANTPWCPFPIDDTKALCMTLRGPLRIDTDTPLRVCLCGNALMGRRLPDIRIVAVRLVTMAGPNDIDFFTSLALIRYNLRTSMLVRVLTLRAVWFNAPATFLSNCAPVKSVCSPRNVRTASLTSIWAMLARYEK
jgi:hypothetical protein